MTELDASDAAGRLGGAPWDFVVRIEPLGSQPTLGLGILVNERVVLTTEAVLPEAGPPFVAVAVVSSTASVQAEPVQRVASTSGVVVVLRLLEPLPRSEHALQFAQPSEGERFETIGEVERDRLTLLGGLLRLGADAPYLTLDVADPGTALAGAPVLVDGCAVGIVTSAGGPDDDVRAEPWTSVAGELAEWAPEIRDAVWPVGPLDNLGTVPGADPGEDFSTATHRVLGWYDAIQRIGDGSPPPTALWTAVVLDAEAFPSQTLATLVPEHLERAPRPARKSLSKAVPDPGQSPRDRFGIQVLPREPSPSLDADRLAALNPVLAKAAEFREATQAGGPIHLRHLLAALVAVWPEDLEDAGGNAGVLRDELLAAIAERAPDDDQQAWRGLFTGGAEDGASESPEAAPQAVSVSALRHRAGYSADIVGKPGSLTDELNVAADVETLCDVLAAKDAIPPVSVGLFGRWGSGKSYFMALMQERMVALAAAAEEARAAGKESAYCADIVQITFNAWHYMDANLWATLAVRIFEGLSTTDDGAEERNEAGALLAELNEREKKLATIDVKIGTALADDRVVTAAKELGVDATRSELIGLAGEVTKFRRYARAARLALFEPDRRIRRRRILVAATVVVVLLVLSVLALTNDTFWENLGVARLAGVAFLGVLAPVIVRIRRALATLNGVLDKAGLKPADVTRERVATDRRLVEIKARLSEIDRRQGFYNFVLERAGSADYRSQFGLISVVRGDLEKLAGQLVDEKLGRRIVLYIDDLDRCPPSRVVEVLQAVHLLLAFPLFVVVVGVDPRWLLRSLQRHYKEVLSSDTSEEDGAFGSDDDRFWESTPQNYLEKIFQIPFALRPMSPTGFGRLVDQLTSAVTDPDDRGEGGRGEPGGTSDQPDPVETNVVRPAGVSAPSGRAADDRASNTSRPTATERIAASAPAAPVPAVEPKPRIDPNPATLLIDRSELEYLKGLAELVATPRETKRLVNLYRLVRASLPADAIEPFLHDRAYQPLLTLLAILVGFPRQAQAVFRGLRMVDRGAAPADVESKVGSSWAKFVARLSPDPVEMLPTSASGEAWSNWIDHSINANEAAEWSALASALEHVATQPDVVDDVGSYSDWVDVVERYLFDTALAQVTRAPREEPPDEPMEPASQTV
jgi:hypothetical protein